MGTISNTKKILDVQKLTSRQREEYEYYEIGGLYKFPMHLNINGHKIFMVLSKQFISFTVWEDNEAILELEILVKDKKRTYYFTKENSLERFLKNISK